MAQNVTIMEALAASAAIYARDGYDVAVDGIVGPWFFDPWKAAAAAYGLDLRYVVLIPSEAETVARATARQNAGAMTDAEVVRTMWQAFQQFPPPPENVLDSSDQSPAETVAIIREGLGAGRFKLP
jgi:hypothetical protein